MKTVIELRQSTFSCRAKVIVQHLDTIFFCNLDIIFFDSCAFIYLMKRKIRYCTFIFIYLVTHLTVDLFRIIPLFILNFLSSLESLVLY